MQSALTFSPFHLPPHPLFFNSPFLSHFSIFSPFQHGWSYRPGERCQMIWLSIIDFVPQTPMWASIVAACLSHILFFFEDQTRCFYRPELKKILHDTMELGSLTVVLNVQLDSGRAEYQNYAKWNCSFQWQRDVNGVACRTGVIVFTLSDLTRQVGTVVASHADILSARHALLLDELVRQ